MYEGRQRKREVSSSHIRHEAVGPGEEEVQMSLGRSNGEMDVITSTAVARPSWSW